MKESYVGKTVKEFCYKHNLNNKQIVIVSGHNLLFTSDNECGAIFNHIESLFDMIIESVTATNEQMEDGWLEIKVRS